MYQRIILAICLIITCFNCYSQNDKNQSKLDSIERSMQKADNSRRKLWEKKDFSKAVILLKNSIHDFQELDTSTQQYFKRMHNGDLYNLSCAYSMLNQADSSLKYLQKSIDNGFNSYYLIINDSDLANIRVDSRYNVVLEKLKKEYDYIEILKQNASYSNEVKYPFPYTYQSSKDEELKNLREFYKLDSVAGNGDEISQIINLMKWVHKTVRHDGNSNNPNTRKAFAIIELCKKENRGVNCRMLATILNEVYLSMGFKSHFVTCLPKDKNDNDCHVINSVYSKTLKKWIWMDPSFETWVKDDKDNFLSIPEVRYRLIHNLPVFASSTINWNGRPYVGGGEKYLKYYMAKNLFQFQIPIRSCVGFESGYYLSALKYVHLVASEYKPENSTVGQIYDKVYYTNDSNQFWEE